MLTALASATMVRRRGLLSMSPPPLRAATVSSLMIRVKTLPRFASAAPFLCLIVCHLEWPDMMKLQRNTAELSAHLTTMIVARAGRGRWLIRPFSPLRRQDYPDVGARIPWSPFVVTEHRQYAKAR